MIIYLKLQYLIKPLNQKKLLTSLKNPNLELTKILIWTWESRKVSSMWFLFGQLVHSVCAPVIWAANSESDISCWEQGTTTFWQPNLLWSLDKRNFFLPCLHYQYFLLSCKNKRVVRNLGLCILTVHVPLSLYFRKALCSLQSRFLVFHLSKGLNLSK